MHNSTLKRWVAVVRDFDELGDDWMAVLESDQDFTDDQIRLLDSSGFGSNDFKDYSLEVFMTVPAVNAVVAGFIPEEELDELGLMILRDKFGVRGELVRLGGMKQPWP